MCALNIPDGYHNLHCIEDSDTIHSLNAFHWINAWQLYQRLLLYVGKKLKFSRSSLRITGLIYVYNIPAERRRCGVFVADTTIIFNRKLDDLFTISIGVTRIYRLGPNKFIATSFDARRIRSNR